MTDVGDKVGRYDLVARLGAGGMGEVFRAVDTQLHRSVALKVLLLAPSAEGTSRELVARMLREARAAAAFNHPNAVAIYDVGEVGGLPFLVMELVAGRSLRSYVDDSSVPWSRKVGWLVQVARALGAAHRAGLVHRDIKPDNVMVRDEDDTAKVLDFGIARASSAVDVESATASPALGTLTAQGAVVGTPLYMAPEQVKHEAVDGRTDQFAWGVMAYELFSANTPWGAKDVYGLVAAILDAEPTPLGELCPELPREVAGAVHRALRKKPDDRFASMDAAADAMAPFAAREEAKPVVALRTDPAVASTPEMDGAIATTALESIKSIPQSAPKMGRGRWAVVAGLAVVALALGGWTMTHAKRIGGPRVSYCADVVERRAGAACAIPLTDDEASHHEDARRVTTVGRHVVKVEVENITGRPWWEPDQEDITEYSYDGDRLASVVGRERHGRVLRRCHYTPDLSRARCTEEDGVSPRFLPDSSVTEVWYEYDAAGFVSTMRYFGRTGKPRPLDGVYGVAYERRIDGLWSRRTTLGADGMPAAQESGVCARTREHAQHGFETSEAYLACDGSSATDQWIHTHVQVLDTYGNKLEERYFGAAGEPRTTGGSGAYGARLVLDANGHQTLLTWLDASGGARTETGSPDATEAWTYDARHRQSTLQALDLGRNLVVGPWGSAMERWVWDDRDDLREEQLLDASGKPVINYVGFAIRKSEYDDNGHFIRQSYFNTDGELVAWSEGPALSEWTFDSRGLETDKRYLDANRQLSPDQRTGAAHWRQQYSVLRQPTRISFFGADDRPTLHNDGVAEFVTRYDADDNAADVAYLDVGGGPAYFRGQFALKRMKYDDRGLIVETSTYDGNNNLILVKDGYAVVRHVRDRSGDIVESLYLGKREEPVLRKGGYATEKTTYDIFRRKIQTSLFDAAGAPVLGSDGWSSERFTLDDRGLVLRDAYFDTAGKPVLTKAGSAAIVKAYDDRGKVVTETTEGVEGAPLTTGQGYAIKRSGYDERALLTEENLLGADGKPIAGKQGWASRRLQYDAIGNQVEEAFLDTNHRPVTPREPAYASARSKFDARTRIIESAYFDASGVPMKGPDGAEIVRYVRDPYGNATETRYLDGAGGPTTSKDGKLVVQSKYDPAGRLVEELFSDAAGAPRRATDGCAGHRTKYDERGRKVEQNCLYDAGTLGVSTDGWATQRTIHDARGNVVEGSSYDSYGKLVADKTGVATRKTRYDERSLKLETALFDALGKPVRDSRGVAVTRYRYDDAGTQVEETVFDERGHSVVVKAEAKKP